MKYDINNTVIVPYLIAEQVTDDRDLQKKMQITNIGEINSINQETKDNL